MLGLKKFYVNTWRMFCGFKYLLWKQRAVIILMGVLYIGLFLLGAHLVGVIFLHPSWTIILGFLVVGGLNGINLTGMQTLTEYWRMDGSLLEKENK